MILIKNLIPDQCNEYNLKEINVTKTEQGLN